MGGYVCTSTYWYLYKLSLSVCSFHSPLAQSVELCVLFCLIFFSLPFCNGPQPAFLFHPGLHLCAICNFFSLTHAGRRGRLPHLCRVLPLWSLDLRQCRDNLERGSM